MLTRESTTSAPPAVAKWRQAMARTLYASSSHRGIIQVRTIQNMSKDNLTDPTRIILVDIASSDNTIPYRADTPLLSIVGRHLYIVSQFYFFVESITSSASPYFTAASALIQKSRSISALILSSFWLVFSDMIVANRSLISRASRKLIS